MKNWQPFEMRYRWLALCVLSACTKEVDFNESFLCPFDLDASQLVDASGADPGTVRCGMLSVPEQHGDPKTTIQLPIVIFKGANPNAPPLVYLDGGPGQTWADLGLNTLTAAHTRAQPHDLIYIEQRGAGQSMPALDCGPQLVEQADSAFVIACRDRLVSQGIRLSAYNIIEMGADVVDLLQYFGYRKAILVGVSYGTAWAQQIMRTRSDLLAGVILDSVVSPLTPPLGAGAEVTDQAFTQLFADAAPSFPNLENEMLDALALLTANPLPTTPELTAAEFFSTTRSLLESDTSDAPAWIDFIDRSAKLGSFNPTYYRSTSNPDPPASSFGQYLSVICSDDQTLDPAAASAALANVRPAFAPFLGSGAEIRALCDSWPYLKRDPSTITLVASDVPTLLLSGNDDPLTAPAWAAQVATRLSHAQAIVVAGVGHDVEASGVSCVNQIVDTFIAKPGPVDNACANHTPSFEVASTFGRDTRPSPILRVGAWWPSATTRSY